MILGAYLVVELLYHLIILCLAFWGSIRLFHVDIKGFQFHDMEHFSFPVVVYENFIFIMSLAILFIYLFIFCYANTWILHMMQGKCSQATSLLLTDFGYLGYVTYFIVVLICTFLMVVILSIFLYSRQPLIYCLECTSFSKSSPRVVEW